MAPASTEPVREGGPERGRDGACETGARPENARLSAPGAERAGLHTRGKVLGSLNARPGLASALSESRLRQGLASAGLLGDSQAGGNAHKFSW